MSFLAFKRFQRTLCCFLEASNWCPGRVSLKYFTSTRCISLMLIFSSWTLCTSLLGCDTWCKCGVVGDLNFLVGKGVTKMASGRLEVSLFLADRQAPKSQLGIVLLLAFSGIKRFCWAKRLVCEHVGMQSLVSSHNKLPSVDPLHSWIYAHKLATFRRTLEKSSCSQDLSLVQGAACQPPVP